MSMDQTDRKILEHLKQDGRASYTEIANSLGVSEGTVRNRVENLVENGVIEKFTVEISEEQKIGAFVMVRVETNAEISGLIEDFPNDLEVFELAGDQDIILKVERETAEDINDIVDEIRSLEGIESTKTYMVLNRSET